MVSADPRDFVAERCAPDPNWFEHAAELWDAYRRWCEARGGDPGTRTALGRALAAAGYRRKQGHVVTWLGVRLR